MSEIELILLIYFIGIVTGFFDSIIGAGGLISVPSLVILGVPPQIAIATDRFGSIGQALIATIKFSMAKKVIWKYVPALGILALIGSFIGANILININPKFLGSLIGILMIALLPLIFLKKDLGIKRFKVSRLILSIASTIIFALNGLINYQLGILLFTSMSIGSYIGSHVAIKKGDKWIKNLFVLLVCFIGIKLLFFNNL